MVVDHLAPTIEVTDEGIEVHAPEIQSDAANVELVPLQGLLGIEHPGARQTTQLKEIYDYLAPKANGVGDLLYQMRELEHRLSPPKLGESRLSKLYNYVKLQNQITQAEAMRDALAQ